MSEHVYILFIGIVFVLRHTYGFEQKCKPFTMSNTSPV
jgi:hypothetical protein